MLTNFTSGTRQGLKVLVAVANGSEDIETITIIDTLRRAGLDVTVGKVIGQSESGNPLEATLMMKTKIIADKVVDSSTNEYDMIVLPGGGEGAKNLASNKEFTELLIAQK